MIAEVFYKLLNSDQASGITAQLGHYAGLPAVFTNKIPDGSHFPAIVISDGGGSDWSVRDARGAVVGADVQIFGDKLMSQAVIHALAKLIWMLVDRHNLWPWIEEAGFYNCGCIADFPMDTGDPQGFPGYTIKTRVQILEIGDRKFF